MAGMRAIYLGNDKWAVRRFDEDGVRETQIILKVADPQLRSSDKAAIELAIQKNDWRRI